MANLRPVFVSPALLQHAVAPGRTSVQQWIRTCELKLYSKFIARLFDI